MAYSQTNTSNAGSTIHCFAFGLHVRRIEPEVKYGLFCHIVRFTWLGLHEANDFKACATTACLNGFALLDSNHQGKHILSLTMRG